MRSGNIRGVGRHRNHQIAARCRRHHRHRVLVTDVQLAIVAEGRAPADERWMPKLEAHSHYHNLDVSTLKEL